MAEDTRELLVAAAPRPRHAPDFEQLWERGRRKRRTARLAGTVGAVVLLVVVGVGLVQLAGPGPGGVPVVDAPESEALEFELGAASVWTSQPQTSLPEAAEAFASQALGWEAVTLDHDQPSTGPLGVTISGPDGQEIRVMFAPDSAENDTWHVLQVGEGAGSLMFDPLALDLDTVPTGADHAQVSVGRHGRTHQLDIDRDQLADGRIALDGRFQDPEDIVAALVIYRDAQGIVLDAGGTHYASDIAP